MSADNDHSHGHAAASRKRLIGALAVTATVLVVELVGAYATGSLALAADAGHMAVDSSGLVVALIAASLMMRPRDDRHTWGYARAETVAAGLQAGMLLIICAVVTFEGIERLLNPADLKAGPMLAIGIVGLVANVVSLMILSGGRGDSLNMRAAFLEVANDALGSAAVIVAAVIAMTTGFMRADAIASLFIAALMAPRAWKLLRRSLAILMEQTPEDLDLDEVRASILAVPGAIDVHDLHATTIATGVVDLSAHVTVTDDVNGHVDGNLVHALEDAVECHFPETRAHTTFQLDIAKHRDHEKLTH